ncbi:MAG: hypothetical protein ACYSU0_21615 [Planctomycetota bacterium]|jgi:hypothetical protein
MNGFGTGALRGRWSKAGVALFVLLPLSVAGCGGGLPARAPSGEPLGVNPYVTSAKIDPRTLKPLEQKREQEKERQRNKPGAPAAKAPN